MDAQFLLSYLVYFYFTNYKFALLEVFECKI